MHGERQQPRYGPHGRRHCWVRRIHCGAQGGAAHCALRTAHARGSCLGVLACWPVPPSLAIPCAMGTVDLEDGARQFRRTRLPRLSGHRLHPGLEHGGQPDIPCQVALSGYGGLQWGPEDTTSAVRVALEPEQADGDNSSSMIPQRPAPAPGCGAPAPANMEPETRRGTATGSICWRIVARARCHGACHRSNSLSVVAAAADLARAALVAGSQDGTGAAGCPC